MVDRGGADVWRYLALVECGTLWYLLAMPHYCYTCFCVLLLLHLLCVLFAVSGGMLQAPQAYYHSYHSFKVITFLLH